MEKYVNTRVIESHRHDFFLVQGQNAQTLNWETLTAFTLDMKELAEEDACDKAKQFSTEVSGLVTAYDIAGHGIKGFVKGEEYKR